MSKTTRRVYKIAAAAAFTAGSVAAIPATFAAEAPADQSGTTIAVTQHPNGEVNVEVTAPAPASTEAPKVEAPAPAATEAPKTEAPKAEAPAPAATEAPKAETPAAAEAPKTEAPKAEAPTPAATEAPKAEAPKAEAPAATEAPKAEAPKAETPAAAEAPKTEAPKAEAPAPAATEAPKTEETPKAEAPAPAATEAPKTEETPKADPKTEQADPAIEIEETDFPADATINTITVRASGFQGAKVGASVNVSIYALDADQQITGEPIATITVDAGQIKDGSFNASLSVPAAQLPAGASYALVAVSNPQAQPAEKLVALSSFKVTETTTPRAQTPKADETPAPETPKADETPVPETPAPETPKAETPKADETPAPETPKADETPAPETPAPETPKAETPKADETPAPETPAAPEPQNATLTTESASLDPNDEYNVVTVNGAGFTHESASRGVQVAIYRLDADGNITGEALAVQDVPASEIMEGTFTTKLSVRADRLLPGYVYALVATSDPNGLVHQVAVTTASVSDADHPAPTVPAASNDDNTTVRDNGDGTTSVFTAEMSEDGSVTVTETRVPSSQAPKAKVGNTPVTASSQSGHTVSARDTAGRTTSDSSSKPQLAHTGAEGVAGIAGVGAAALIAGAALMLLRRRSL
ncbi:LPXTG cell wall anchor domain-containing protein [uncultured Rothia sp.]|uniref:LPXTG cell wall anchor domain-containing protein n=1 Tax=uncultured Rothia sp. TaxID=316088 RepID=UPI002622BAF1|nr:LPXTG cell wall anchor domain-containing protein [uncultured Rothia sp.]